MCSGLSQPLRAWWRGLHPRVQFHMAWSISSVTGSSSVLQHGCSCNISVKLLLPAIDQVSADRSSFYSALFVFQDRSMCCFCTLVPINEPRCFSYSGLIKQNYYVTGQRAVCSGTALKQRSVCDLAKDLQRLQARQRLMHECAKSTAPSTFL